MLRSARRHRTAAATVVGALMLVTGACGSAGGSGSDAGSSTAAGAKTAGQRAAADYLAQYSENPTTVGDLTPLSKKVPAGKSVIYLVSPSPVAHRNGDGIKAAATKLGWTYGEVDAGPTPASAASGFEAAIARKPDAIVFGGYSADVLTKQIQEAKAAGIVVSTIGTADGPTDGISANLGGAEQEAVYGKLVAAYFVAHGDAKASAGVVTLSGQPIFTAFTDSFEAAVKEWCASCKTSLLSQQFSDLGTKTPANIVAFLQRHPDVKWVIGTTGDLTQGARAAINAAGIKGINIIGEVPTAANLTNLKAGTETAWAGYAIDVLSWRLVDVLARQFIGDDVAAAASVPLPVQMLTKDNVDESVLDEGYYVGVSGYQDQFAKLWQVG